MQKDQLRHNSSNCTYPPPTTTTTNTTPGLMGLGGHGADGDGRGPMDERAFREFFGFGTEQLSTSFDPFTFEEIRQALGPGMGGDTSERSMPSLPLEDSDASAAAGERAMVVDMKPAIPPDMDYDTMLAMQLAAEDTTDPDPDAHLNQLINNFEKRSRQHVRRTPSQDDDVVVPASPPDQNDFDAAGFAPGGPRNQFFPTSPTRSRQRQADPTEELWSSINRRDRQLTRNRQMKWL
nr:hypothetical protein BaRGS_002812 [Batillaria attramentaria]